MVALTVAPQKLGLYADFRGQRHAAGQENADAVLDGNVRKRCAPALAHDDVSQVQVIGRHVDRDELLGSATAIDGELSRQESEREAAVRIVARIGILAMALVFLWAGIEFTRFAWNRTSELADLPLWLIHVAWPVAAFTWIVFAGEQIVDEARILFGTKR